MNIKTDYFADPAHVKPLGRTYFHNNRLFCALSGTGAEFSFSGTSCFITIMGDAGSASPLFADSHARIAIFVNGNRIIDDLIDQPSKTYCVLEGESEIEAVVSIVKLSESPMSTVSIDRITVTGSAPRPTKEKKRLIEFIGDSITCGYGVDDPVPEHPFATRTEDVTKSYAYRTAQMLDADCSIVSFSGYGIISGFTVNDSKLANQLVPPLYTKLGYSWSQNRDFVPSEIKWDFTKRQPDAVVINLGTNDDSYTKDIASRQEEYASEYTKFLKLLRTCNPNALLLCTLGIMGDRLFPFVQKAVAVYQAETGDSGIHTMKFDVQDALDGYSANFHPSVATHGKAARRLAEELKKVLSSALP